MKPITSIILFCGLLVSCYKPYTADIDSKEEEVLVVEGLITNEVAPYQISLSYALPFYSENARQPVKSARVYVYDDEGNYHRFKELKNGYYISDPLIFTGRSGRTYSLSIETPDGEVYMSDPQKLSFECYPDTVYAEYGYQKTIDKFNDLTETIAGANILTDLIINSDTFQPVRFTAKLVKEYFYELSDRIIYPNGQVILIPLSFYCWETDNLIPDINLAGNDYSLTSYQVRRQLVYFVEDQISFEAIDYLIGIRQPDLSYKYIVNPERKYHNINHRILYLDMYTLNLETYSYYKRMDEQLRSEGKLFDPISTQLIGNIHCTTNPDRKAFGFFEASSISRQTYQIGFRNLITDQYDVKKVCCRPPEPDGCIIDQKPPFWGY